MKIHIRRMQEKDIPNIYEYIHKNYVHKYYSMVEQEQWEAHSRWYRFVLHSTSYFFYILELEEEFLGTIRYELEEERAIVSIFIREEYRRKGYAKFALLESQKKFLEELETEIAEIEAVILKENEVSQKLFLSCGFTPVKKELYCYDLEGKGQEKE